MTKKPKSNQLGESVASVLYEGFMLVVNATEFLLKSLNAVFTAIIGKVDGKDDILPKNPAICEEIGASRWVREILPQRGTHESDYQELTPIYRQEGDYDTLADELIKKSLIVVIAGKRGSGKSTLAFRLLENGFNKTNKKCYAIGVEREVLPTYIKVVTNIDQVAPNSILVVDEAGITFNARDSQNKGNKSVSDLMMVARKKDCTLIFVTQNTGTLDRNIMRLVDVLMFKESSLLQEKFERRQVIPFFEESKAHFDNYDTNERIKYVYIISDIYKGFNQVALPSFWNEKISKSVKVIT